MKKPSYTNIILTIIAILLALLVWEQRYVLSREFVLNRITGKAYIVTKFLAEEKSESYQAHKPITNLEEAKRLFRLWEKAKADSLKTK